MKPRNILVASTIAGLLIAPLCPLSAQVDWPQLKLTQVASGLVEPVHVTSARDGSGRLFIVEQPGKIEILESGSILPSPFLDITDRVSSPPGDSYGLLSVAFPASFASKRCFYVYYSRTNDQASIISRFFLSANTNQADATSEQPLLIISKGVCHPLLGGQIAFGSDGYLYISTGSDEGCLLLSLAQTPNSLWGKVLRIDVESTTNGYTVPASNPFVGNSAYSPEVWAMGFRNPWRFSFDRLTGDFYIGDVGQGSWEEVDFHASNSPAGQNFGWDVLEGNHLNGGDTLWDTNDFSPPLIEYPHTGGSSVTGGFVYRGPAMARMDGIYFFGDFISGRVWGLARSGSTAQTQVIPVPPHFISSFGEDDLGRLYLADYFGKVFLVEDSGLAGPPEFQPEAGVITDDHITIICPSPGAAIHFTTNGVIPTQSDPTVSPGGSVIVLSGATLSARAFRADLQPSTVTSATYTLRAGTPAFSPPHGPVTNGTLVAMTTATPGATIRYTLDGSDPTAASLLYSAPIAINSTNLVSARAFRPGFQDSSLQRVYFNGAVSIANVILLAGPTFNINWQSETGRTYQVQASSNLLNWADIGSPLAGNEQMLSYATPVNSAVRFLRLRIY